MTRSVRYDPVAAVARAICHEDEPMLLLTDFDGTLCEFLTDPERVELTPTRRRLLASLAAHPQVDVGVVSGRPLENIKRRVALDEDLYYAGLHGCEIEGPHSSVTAAIDDVDLAELADAATRLEAIAADVGGAFVEYKRQSVTLHLRAATPNDRRRAEATFHHDTRDLLARGRIRLQPGDCVLELVASSSWTKGDAVTWIRRDLEARRATRARPVYLGDDRTDEHAFAAIGSDGVSVAVGPRPSGASYRLPDPAAVERLLGQLLENITHRR